MDRIRVLIADDHVIVREGLRQLLENRPDIDIVGEAADGEEALRLARDLTPDVSLIDIAMPRLNGIEATRLIKESMPESKIVILSMHKKEIYVQEVLSAGALGYVLKASSSSEVIEAIRAAHRGEYFLSSKIESDLIREYLRTRERKPPSTGYDLLTKREQQVFRLVVEGHSTNEISELLFVSPKTVEKHRTNIMKKLGLNDAVEMVKYAIKIGVVDPELWEH